MDLFTYLMAKNDHNTSVNKDLFSYLLGKGQSGNYQTYTGTSISASNTKKAKMHLSLYGNTSQTGTPTPTSPIPVNVVSGDNEVVVGNAPEIFKMKQYATQNSSYFTYSSETGLTATSQDNRAIADVPAITDFETNKTYNIIGTTTARIVVSQWSSSNGWVKTDNLHCGDSFTTASNTAYLRIKIDQISSYPLVLGNIYMSTTTEYTSQTYPINLGTLELCKIGTYQDYFMKNTGKNLFDKNNSTRIYAYLQGNLTSWTYANDSYSVRIPCQPNTSYTISANNSSETIFRAGVTDSDSVPVSGTEVTVYSVIRNSNTNTPIVVTTGANAKYIVVQVAEGTATGTLNTLQIEKGNQATTYEPYGTGQWCKYNAIGKVVLDGTQGFTLRNTSANNTYTYVMDTPFQYIRQLSIQMYSDYFTLLGRAGALATMWNEYLDMVGIGYYYNSGNTNKGIYINTKDTLPTWFSTHNTSIYYPLETPYLSLITDTTLIEQLNNIENAMSYKGTTNVNQINNDLPFNMEAKIKVAS